jgi:hypothetical protein
VAVSFTQHQLPAPLLAGTSIITRSEHCLAVEWLCRKNHHCLHALPNLAVAHLLPASQPCCRKSHCNTQSILNLMLFLVVLAGRYNGADGVTM